MHKDSTGVQPTSEAKRLIGWGTVLPRDFYAREPVVVAEDLLGQRLVRVLDGVALSGRIVETEAYRGTEDAASHARMGRTDRNAPMFGPPGHAYVYFIYGMHWMFNISAHPQDSPGAVLIRALEPEGGIDVMSRLRRQVGRQELTNGPAKLAQALAINDDLNGLDLCAGQQFAIFRADLREGEKVSCGPRVRVPGGEEAKQRPWRFWIASNAWVSS
jgi:DNA-3-methyladenine glycosylase